jgi:hypothetical protein
MHKQKHAHKIDPESKPTHDEVAVAAYYIYLKEGRPNGHDIANWLEAETKLLNEASDYHHPYPGHSSREH